MTKDEAIAWAVRYIVEALEYEYYESKSKAEYAVQAISLLSNKRWRVKSSDDRYWLICES